MKNIYNLSLLGFPQYYIDEKGRVFNILSSAECRRGKNNVFYLKNQNGKWQKISLKRLYYKAFNKQLCEDNIINIAGEIWKEIPDTMGKYFVSNMGRIKSLCGYKARILKQYKNENNYYSVSINGKHKKVHKLVAVAFCENNFKDQKIEIHHKDKNRHNNKADNLEILSIEYHRQIHSKRKKEE